MYKILEKPGEAKKYLLKSLVVDSILKDTTGVIISYENIGTVCKLQHDYKGALNYYKKALQKLESLSPEKREDLNSVKANLLTNVGNIYMNYITNTDNDPLAFYNKALALREKSNDRYNSAITYQNIGYYYFKKKNYTQSEKYYQKAETIAKDINNAELLMSILKDEFEIYASRKKFDLAYSIYKNYAALHDSIYNENSNRVISEIQIKYETEKKQKENALLKKDNEIKILQIESKNRVIIFLIIGIIIIVLSFVLVFIQFVQKKRAYNTLAEKNLEIVEAEKEYDKNFRIIKNKRNQNNEEHDGESRQLADKLVAYMTEEKPYLYSDISLEAVSQHLQTNRSYLSKVINEHFNKNFNGFINEYRIKTARQILADPDKDHLSIEGIGQMVGFNSMSTFFSSFKKYTGITPSFFRDTIK
jgi:YesN/AraC family two-component response regulator